MIVVHRASAGFRLFLVRCGPLVGSAIERPWLNPELSACFHPSPSEPLAALGPRSPLTRSRQGPTYGRKAVTQYPDLGYRAYPLGLDPLTPE